MRRTASEIINNLENRIARLERQTKGTKHRSASTHKVAGHIVLAGSVNIRQLQRAIEDTPGVEDLDLDDGDISHTIELVEDLE